MKLLGGYGRNGGSKLVRIGKEETDTLGEFILLYMIHSFIQQILTFIKVLKYRDKQESQTKSLLMELAF